VRDSYPTILSQRGGTYSLISVSILGLIRFESTVCRKLPKIRVPEPEPHAADAADADTVGKDLNVF
jgi:hypothetical protein